MRQLPPLHALRAFEAAARHAGFRAAADELSVTPSAVSHRIRALEEWFGLALFERVGRGVVLSPAGRELMHTVRDALDRIEDAGRRLRAGPRTGVLTVSSAPAFATGWLVPRLSEFQVDHPGIDVRLTTAVAFADFPGSDVDLAITYGHGEWPGLHCDRLMTEELVPVCSPDLLAPRGPLRDLADVHKLVLLHVLPRIGQWRSWLAAAGLTEVDAERGPKFQTTPLALEAAMAGHGIAIANRRFVQHHLDAGALAVPFEIDLPSTSGYYLLYPQGRAAQPAVAAFREWVLAKLDRERARAGGPLGGLPGT